MLASSITIVAGQLAISLVLGEFKTRSTFTSNATLWSLTADVGTTMVFVHAIHSFFWALDTGVLVVTQKKAITTMALVTPHHVDTGLLAATISLCALIHIKAVMAIMC